MLYLGGWYSRFSTLRSETPCSVPCSGTMLALRLRAPAGSTIYSASKARLLPDARFQRQVPVRCTRRTRFQKTEIANEENCEHSNMQWQPCQQGKNSGRTGGECGEGCVTIGKMQQQSIGCMTRRIAIRHLFMPVKVCHLTS